VATLFFYYNGKVFFIIREKGLKLIKKIVAN